MKFSIGDPVYILQNNEEGVIEEFIGKDMASVRVHDKYYHVYLDDMEHPYLRWFLKSNKNNSKKKTPYIDQIGVEKNPERKAVLPEGIYLVFMPIYKLEAFEDVVDKIKVFLYNETSLTYRFDYACNVKSESLFSIESEINGGNQFYIHDIQFEEIANSPGFLYRFVNILDIRCEGEGNFVLKPKKLFEKLNEIKYQNHPFFYFLLFEKIVAKEKKEVVIKQNHVVKNIKKDSSITHFDFEHALKKSVIEIDLHIEKLVKEHSHMGASEILHIQLTECQKALDLAYATHQHMLVIIHGIGKGVLKNEINSLLNQTKGIRKYVNEFDVRYGYGATKVFFNY